MKTNHTLKEKIKEAIIVVSPLIVYFLTLLLIAHIVKQK